jgi:hypothetical protein
MTVASKSGISLTFDKPVSFTTKDTYSITVDSDKKIHIGNSVNDIKKLLTDLVTEIKNLRTFGSPGAHAVDPSSITSLETFVTTKLNVLFE